MTDHSVIHRYVTSDFKSAPVLALADLMGLDREHKQQVMADPEFYGSLL